jgi:hypothetical protein
MARQNRRGSPPDVPRDTTSEMVNKKALAEARADVEE